LLEIKSLAQNGPSSIILKIRLYDILDLEVCLEKGWWMNIIFLLGFKKHFYIGSLLLILTGLIIFYLLEYTSIYYEHTGIIFLIGITNMFVIPLYLFNKIKCPDCQYKIFWHYLNESKINKGKKNPFLISVCPNCAFDPSKQ